MPDSLALFEPFALFATYVHCKSWIRMQTVDCLYDFEMYAHSFETFDKLVYHEKNRVEPSLFSRLSNEISSSLQILRATPSYDVSEHCAFTSHS